MLDVKLTDSFGCNLPMSLSLNSWCILESKKKLHLKLQKGNETLNHWGCNGNIEKYRFFWVVVSKTKLVVRLGLEQSNIFLFREQHQNVKNTFKTLAGENKRYQTTKSGIAQSSSLCWTSGNLKEIWKYIQFRNFSWRSVLPNQERKPN